MSEEQEDFKKKLDALKPKKKKLAVPEGFLESAKSYEGKLEAVKIITEREKNKVILIFKGLIAGAEDERKRIELAKEKAKKEEQEKEAKAKAAKLEAEKKTKSKLFGKK